MFNTQNFDALNMLQINPSRPSILATYAFGDCVGHQQWHQVVEMPKETSTKFKLGLH